MRNLTAERRKMLSLAVSKRRRDLKLAAVDYKGGKCSRCGYNKSAAALDFHHIDPKQKEIRVGCGRTISLDRIKIELDKCILVCANCHREIHEEWKRSDKEKQELLLKEKSRKPKITTNCTGCGKEMNVSPSVFHDKITCSIKCRNEQSEKIEWPSDDELKLMVSKSSKLAVSKLLGVSDKAVSKRLKRM